MNLLIKLDIKCHYFVVAFEDFGEDLFKSNHWNFSHLLGPALVGGYFFA